MSTVIYVGTEKPDKRLKEKTIYKAYLSDEQKKEILEQIRLHYPRGINFEDYIISMYVHIELKEYDTKDT